MVVGFHIDRTGRGQAGGIQTGNHRDQRGPHPVLFPAELDKADDLILNLKILYGQEKLCGGIVPSLGYETYLEQRMASWQKMCSFLRTNRAFQAVTKQVDADWYEVVS